MHTGNQKEKRKQLIQEYKKERLAIVTKSAETALKSAFLVNGGGAVALLAFFGNATQQEELNFSAELLTRALLILVFGTATAGVATASSFLAQYGYFIRKRNSFLGKHAQMLTIINILLVLLSYVLFVAAGFVAYYSLYVCVTY